jgi:N6-L-threonylcarbamoyladenine synthase
MRQASVEWSGIDAIAVTEGPGLIGSLLVGMTYAKSLSFALGIPLIGINHIEGHIHAVILETRRARKPVELPALALVVSGGHTHLFEVTPQFTYRLLGRTRDDAAGEAFDKVGKLLGLGYPGGPLIDRLASFGNSRAVKLPLARMKSNALDFSFSGLKTAVLRWVESHDMAAEIEARRALLRVIASFQYTVIMELLQHAAASAEKIGARSVIVAGGVACNSGLRAAAQLNVPVHFPSVALSTDNAVMIAAAAFPKYHRREFSSLDASVSAHLPLSA